MGKYRAFAKNAVIITTGTVMSKLVAFIMVRFYTGILTPAEFGTADILITTVSLLTPFVSMGIAEGVFRFVPEYPKAKRSIFTIGIYTIAAGSLIFIILLPVLSFVGGLRGYLAMLVFMTLAACFHSVCEQFVRAEGDTTLFAGQGILNTVLLVALNILFLKGFKLGITGYVLSVAVADVLCTAFLFVKKRLWRMLIPRPNAKLARKMLRYSIPLIPTTAFWWITASCDRYMIDAIIGSDANGIYTVANKLPSMLALFAGVIMQAWQFSAISERNSAEGEQARFYSNVWSALMSLMFLAAGAMTAFSRLEVRLLAAPEYFEAWRSVPILTAAMLFCSFTAFMGSVYTVTRKSVLSFRTSLLGAVINVILNAVLIPSPLGIYGAGLATFASYFIVFLVRAKSARRLIPFRLFKRALVLNTTVLAVQTVFISFSLPGWQIAQAAAIIIILLNGRHQVMETLSALRLNAGRKRHA